MVLVVQFQFWLLGLLPLHWWSALRLLVWESLRCLFCHLWVIVVSTLVIGEGDIQSRLLLLALAWGESLFALDYWREDLWRIGRLDWVIVVSLLIIRVAQVQNRLLRLLPLNCRLFRQLGRERYGSSRSNLRVVIVPLWHIFEAEVQSRPFPEKR